jgi:16S rRNA (uracil1498-N3)-methyltransferase
MQLFYHPDITETSKNFTFPTEESKHIVKVLRKKDGDILYLTNGKGFLFEAKITAGDVRKCAVEIVNSTFQAKKEPFLHLAVAPTKMNDRYEWFLEKATEIGVSEITPLICEHSERKIIKLDRFEKVLQSAMKQSLHYHIPTLNEAITLNEFVSLNHPENRFIAHCEEMDKTELKDRLKPNENALILIGPEGDFSTKEIQSALKNGFLPIALGTTRLRTETAAIYATACFSILNA